MTLQIYRLRRLLAGTAILLTAVVAGMYFYARWRATSVLNKIPGKLGIEISKTANGFQFSKSDGKRTLFTIEATDLKEFKFNGRTELHNVSIVLYGRDSSRFDQIYGKDFAYDPKTGDVTAKGEVQIDLVANPAGLASPDQSAPKELKNPIHLNTRDLVFNRETGNASTDALVEFRTAQASGTGVGVRYVGRTNTLTLESRIHIELAGVNAAVINAQHGVITNEPREVVLERPHLERDGGITDADQAVFHLNADNNVERVLATGNVHTQTRSSSGKSVSLAGRSNPAPTDSAQVIRGRADQAEFLLTGSRDLLRTATMTGNVHFEQTGPQAMQGDAGRVIMEFAGQNQLQKVHALDGARLTQRAASSGKPAAKGMANGPQDFELSAPVIDFAVDQGHILKHAETSGAAQITIAQAADANAQAATGQRTIVTAGKFVGEFTTAQGKNHLATLHGAPNARIVSAGPIGSTPVGSAAVASVSINSTPAPADRVSISDSVDAVFLPRGGIESITQTGNFVYTDNQQPTKRMQAWADSALYTPADQMLALSGSPRVAEGAMATTANSIRINRATGDALAEGDVKSTYSQMKEQPGGALLASSSPIHVTSRSMTAHNAGGVALYSGHARLWQDANIIEAPSIQFDRDRRFVTAQGTAGEPVQTILVQTAKAQTAEPPITGTSTGKRLPGGKEMAKGSGPAARSAGSSPIGITADRLTYADSERRVHYETGVVAKSADFTASAKTLDAYLLPRSQTAANQSFAGPGQLDRMVAQSDVVITQPNRRAEGQKLVYTAADDRFVLTGGPSSGPPSIFDAEQGKITGVSLTFFRGDDRVLVEGEASTPVVTQTRVAK